MWFGILIVIVALGIGVCVGLKQGNVARQLIADGRMIARDPSFVSTAEIFTSKTADFEKVSNKLLNDIADFSGTGVTIKVSDEAKLVLFSSSLGLFILFFGIWYFGSVLANKAENAIENKIRENKEKKKSKEPENLADRFK